MTQPTRLLRSAALLTVGAVTGHLLGPASLAISSALMVGALVLEELSHDRAEVVAKAQVMDGHLNGPEREGAELPAGRQPEAAERRGEPRSGRLKGDVAEDDPYRLVFACAGGPSLGPGSLGPEGRAP